MRAVEAARVSTKIDPRPRPRYPDLLVECERCGAELPEGANFCSNCGAARPVAAQPAEAAAAPCVQCSELVERGAQFCWNCGVRDPHRPPAVTGETVVGAPPSAPEGFEWDEGGEETFEPDPPTRPRMVASMIAEELADPKTEPRGIALASVVEEGSQPLALEPDVDAAVAAARADAPPTSLSEEVAELQLLLLRGFEAEAREAWSLLTDAHPEHPDLEVLAEQFRGDGSSGPDATLPGTDASDVTLVTRAPDAPSAASPGPVPVESPTSPTFVEGTAPPPGGFAAAPAVPQPVEPNVTPRLGIESGLRSHMPSSDSLPTNPRMVDPRQASTAVSTPSKVRIVMLGSRGQAVWERTLGPVEHLDIGREPIQPWGDDPHLEPHHARLRPIPGSGVVVEPQGDAAVYRQVDERLAVRDGDEFRVGESLLRYSMSGGGWGALRVYPLSSDEGDAVPIGGSGVLVGRENADIELPEDTFVSGAHCQFSCRDEGLFVEDLGSANGTYTRVRKGEAVPFGAQLLLGQTLFTVRRAGG